MLVKMAKDRQVSQYSSRKIEIIIKRLKKDKELDSIIILTKFRAINKIYTNRNKRSKIYQHKKFNSTMYGLKNSNLVNKSQTDKNNENNEFNTIDFHIYDAYSLTNTISVVDSKSFNTNTYREKIFNSSNKKQKNKEAINNNWKIKKVSEFLIDTNKDLNIGFELGNSECKIGINNEFLNTVELWAPSENEDNNNDLSIQSLISFKDKNDNIIIGNKAEELKISNPKYSIFNLIKCVGKNYDEIIGKKELWPYKIYNNVKTGRPYIKVYYNDNKNKIYNFEDLLSLFLRKLFELLFSKFKFKNDNNNKNSDNLININIIVTVPNNFNYFQRKVVEKIFQIQLFQKEKINLRNSISNFYSEDNKNKNKAKNDLYTFGKFKIKNNNIKIENSSNIGYIYLFQK